MVRMFHLAPPNVGPVDQAVAVVLDRYRMKLDVQGAEAAWAWLAGAGRLKALSFLTEGEQREALGRIFSEVLLTGG